MKFSQSKPENFDPKSLINFVFLKFGLKPQKSAEV